MREIERRGRDGACSCCGEVGDTFTLSEIADGIEVALEEHFYRISTEPSDMGWMAIKEGDLDWGR